MRSGRWTVLALTIFALSGFALFQENPSTQIENPDYWIGLIEKYTPPITAEVENFFCYGELTYAANAVAAAAEQKQLWWTKPPIVGTTIRGEVRWDPDDETIPLKMLINEEHPSHVSDYEFALTMAHEGIHWHYGIYIHVNGVPLNFEDSEQRVRDIISECFLPEEEEDEDEEEPSGGQTCTEEPYTYTESVPVWTQIEAGSCVGVSPVALPGEEPGEPELHCTPAVWGWVYEDRERTGMRTVCVLNN